MMMMNMPGSRQEPYTAHELISHMTKVLRREIEVVRGLSIILAATVADDTKGAIYKAKAETQVREMEIAASMVESLLVSKS